jgi:assimilatory nitrate reductase catalytic subunit
MSGARRLADLLRTRRGRLTDELRRERGDVVLGQVPSRLLPDGVTSLICGYCSTGCSLDVHVQGGVPVNLTPTRGYPVNGGSACPKGWEALTPLGASDRGTTPLVRDGSGHLRAASWDAAIGELTSRAKAIVAEHGPESMAYLSTGQIPTEEMALLGTVAKFGMGLVHGDSNTRQCMATSAVAYKQSLGFDAPPYTYDDLEQSDVILLIGSNLCIAHPILWERVLKNRHDPAIVVVDPRATETAMAASHHYAIQPKSDLTFLYGLAHLLIERGAVDRAFIDASTTGFDAFADFVRTFRPDVVSAATGIPEVRLHELADLIATGERVSFWWTMGVNQSHESTRTAQAIINLALLTGNIGRPGTGANSITGQCNAMGSRLFGNTTNLLGGRDFADAGHRDEVATVLGIDADRIPTRASDAYDQILEGVVAGRIKALWIVATNSAHSWINQGHAREVLERLELLVVQDLYPTTDTARYAHVYLPAAGWGEKEGTFINSERRIGPLRAVAAPPGEAKSDFEIFRLVAESWGCGDLVEKWRTPEDAFRLLAQLSAGRPCDFSGIGGFDDLTELGGVQWPHPAGQSGPPATERRLFEDGRFFTDDGRARFVFDAPRPPREQTSALYPLILLTGRGSSAQWHTGTRTDKSPLLRSLAPAEPYVEVSPLDADARRIAVGDTVVVESARGVMRARAFVTSTVQPGQVFVPMHFVDTNKLTAEEFDPHSRQPSYKHCAVEVRRPTASDR